MEPDFELLKARYPSAWKAKAMEMIWTQWYRRLAAFIRTSYGARGQVDDLMQEIMAKVFQNLERYKPAHPLSPWLYAIARNTCISHFASECRGGRGVDDGLAEEPRARGSVEDEVLGRTFERDLLACLAELGAEDRGIAFLVFYEQAGYAHIAEVYGLPMHGVKNRVHRIRMLLRRQLEDYRETE